MATTPLTLAALATSAVPDLYAVGAREHSAGGEGEYTSVVVTTDVHEVIVRVPLSDAANAQISAEILGQNALTAGARAQLPFAVPEILGVTRAGDSRAVVATFLPGEKFLPEDLTADSLLVASIAGAIEGLHALPTSIIADAGLPIDTADQGRVRASRLVEKATATGLLPVTVKEHWLSILRDLDLWDYAPTVVHGSLDADKLLVSEDSISGVLGFDAIQVADPAVDFAWLCAAEPRVLEEVVHRYAMQDDHTQALLVRRARFYHELEIAKWLLHGVEKHDQLIIDDAVAMFDGLVDRIEYSPAAATAAQTPINLDSVQELLDRTPRVASSDRDEFAEVDDDRIFHADTDFIEPLDESGARPESSADTADSDAGAGADEDSLRS